jgi:hypothetical protein
MLPTSYWTEIIKIFFCLMSFYDVAYKKSWRYWSKIVKTLILNCPCPKYSKLQIWLYFTNATGIKKRMPYITITGIFKVAWCNLRFTQFTTYFLKFISRSVWNCEQFSVPLWHSLVASRGNHTVSNFQVALLRKQTRRDFITSFKMFLSPKRELIQPYESIRFVVLTV